MSAGVPRTVFVSGIFNILHPGHVRLLRFASEVGDRLIVGVIPDSQVEDFTALGERSRLEAIQSLRMVDQAFLLEDSVQTTVRELRPDIVVKGREHAKQTNEESEVLSEYGGRLIFSSGDSFFSASDLISNELGRTDQPPVVLPRSFMQQHGISLGRLIEVMQAIEGVRVLVVGDSIVDEYISCHPLGMSREDPTVVVTPTESKSFVGGAAIVAAHAAGVGREASLFTVVGLDSHSDFLRDALARYSVDASFHIDESRPTTAKQRWRAGGKTLLRVSHLHQDPIPLALQQELYEGVRGKIGAHDLLIFSDFNYGSLPQSLVQRLVSLGQENGVTLAADSQTSSQIGDISRFTGMDLITPTEYEARVATRNFEDGLVVLADQLRQKAHAGMVLMTLAEDGVFIRGATAPSGAAFTDQLPALNGSPKDVAGAGDALLVLASMALSVGASMYEAALLGSIAAAVQVSTTGNRPIDRATVLEILAT